METILIVDDDVNVCQSLSRILSRKGYKTIESHTAASGLQLFAKNEIDATLLDLMLPDSDGIEIARQMTQQKPNVPIIVLSAYGTISRAVEATKAGVYDFLEKPVDRDRILVTLRNALSQSHLKQELEKYKKHSLARYKMVGQSDVMIKLFQMIDRIAPMKTPVLILGDNGVGKELVAQAIHQGSTRNEKQLIKINCAAIPENLIESELFGHTKGAFTSAHVAKKGRFEVADGGTLFLDEIGDLSLSAQAKLLRFLENGEIQRVGTTEISFSDVRVIAASNKDLQQMVEECNFREDLFYRLSGFPLYVPPLSQRQDDIPLLIDHFMNEYVEENGMLKPKLTPAAMNYLKAFDWRGNVRQLRSFVERMLLLIDGGQIDLADVKEILLQKNNVSNVHQSPQQEIPSTLSEARQNFEREYIRQILIENNMKVAKAAAVLGMDRANLYRKMRGLGIEMSA
ncbi:response regulator [candidate division KSB1 bacterium]|nr:response regulator [candidate division KSB1 bacterium]